MRKGVNSRATLRKDNDGQRKGVHHQLTIRHFRSKTFLRNVGRGGRKHLGRAMAGTVATRTRLFKAGLCTSPNCLFYDAEDQAHTG